MVWKMGVIRELGVSRVVYTLLVDILAQESDTVSYGGNRNAFYFM